jgi:NAD(P)-dependent dehydrogenase (short-subunit alcohol dehydrogenase family)
MNPTQGVLREQSHFHHFMDIAIVTGAETPLGLRLIEDLIRQGCRVHGIGNNLSHVTFTDKHFIAHAIDLSDLEAVARTAEAILEKEKAIHILIHAIDVTPGAAFEQLPVGNLEAILKVGLLGPVMLTRLVLPNLLRFRGQLINIIPANKSGHIASAVNALIEGGLREMNNALFDQARDAGLRVTNLILRQNTMTDDTTFADKHLQTRIDPEHVARTVEQLLNPNEPNVPNEITLYPRLSGAAEEVLPETALAIDPYNAVVLPPQEYCPPEQAAILTKEPDQIERTIPYTDEEMEEKIASAIEDYESQPKHHEVPKRNKKNHRNDRDQAPKRDSLKDAEQSDQLKSRRGRRRGGRNRSKNREQTEDNTSTRHDHRHQSNSTEKKSPVGDKNTPIESKQGSIPLKAARPGGNRSRKPIVKLDEKHPTYEQSSRSVAESPETAFTQPKQDAFQPQKVSRAAPISKKKKISKPKKTPAIKPQQQIELISDTPAVKKKAIKKAAKKITKKVLTKKVAVKKSVKRVATKKTATKKVSKKTAAKKATKKAVKKTAKKTD